MEDDQLTRSTIERILEPNAHVMGVSSGEQALKLDQFDLALVDLDLEKPLLGFEVIQKFHSLGKYSAILTGHEEEGLIERGYELGCQDYLLKPFSKGDLLQLLERYHSWRQGQRFEQEALKENIEISQGLKEVSATMIPLLLSGETGTGKGFLARMIHQSSRPGSFVHINCAELSESLLASELFGHKKGAFTGALFERTGRLKEADGGTLFLDEIGAMEPSLQAKFLKVLEEKRFTPIGSNGEQYSDFRLITATCDSLSDGKFRSDLYHRIAGFHHRMKPLRGDQKRIWDLVQRYQRGSSRRIVYREEAKERLLSYSWPGNIRELRHLLDRVFLSGRGIVDNDFLQELGVASEKKSKDELAEVREKGLRAYIRNHERDIVSKIVAENGGAVRKSLNILKISNGAYYNLIGESDAK